MIQTSHNNNIIPSEKKKMSPFFKGGIKGGLDAKNKTIHASALNIAFAEKPGYIKLSLEGYHVHLIVMSKLSEQNKNIDV